MLKTRLIPVLLLQNGLLVRSEGFSTYQIIGNPINEVERFNEWSVDELIYLDISRDNYYDLRRNDQKVSGLSNPLQILSRVSKTCFIPLTWGGKIETVDNMYKCLSHGADKIAINSYAFLDPELISAGAKIFGSQAIVVSIDVKRTDDGFPELVIRGGREKTGINAINWAKEVEQRGAGEILLQSVCHDGFGLGYDLALIKAVCDVTTIPIIACSGVGKYEHYVDGILAGASAVAAANIWHYKELADRNAKRIMTKAGISVRI